MLKPALFTLLLVFCLTQIAGAQTLDESPEQVAERYLKLFKTDGRSAAKLMHPEALTRFKSIMAPLFDKKPPTTGRQIFGVKSAVEYNSLSAEEVYSKFMEYLFRTYPGLDSVMAGMETKIIGSVVEGEVVHVLYRGKAQAEGASFEKVEVLELKRNGPVWALMLSGDFEGMFKSVAKSPSGATRKLKRRRNK